MTEQKSVPELDQLFAALRSATPRPGLEDRILTHLDRLSRTQQESEGFRSWLSHDRRAHLSSSWLQRVAPAAIAASLVCVVAGGLAVQHEYSLTLPASHATQASIMQSAVQLQAQTQAAAFDTASARREPAGAIPAGARKGRGGRGPARTKAHHTQVPR